MIVQSVLHNIASSSSFFRFRADFLAFFARISYFKFLEFKEFNKTIIRGWELLNSQPRIMHFAYSDWFTQSWLSAHIP